MLQISIFLVLFSALIIPLGKYLYHIAGAKRTFADPLFNRVDGLILRLCGIEGREMSWKQYAKAMLATNLLMALPALLILQIQALPIFNPNHVGSMEAFLSINTVISFLTNTNLQHYAGESGMSHLAQMMMVTFLMFTSAATGISVAFAFMRGLAGKTKTLGNYYVDMVRVTTRVLLPLAFIVGLLLVTQGVPQTLSGIVTVNTIEGKLQDIALGPVAALESIKHLGTNGGGFFGANSASPFENPNIVTNMIEMLSMMVIPGAMVIAFGHMVKQSRKENPSKTEKEGLIGKEAKPLLLVMAVIFVLGLALCVYAERAGNPAFKQAGLSQSMGNMEGKELRFGVDQSALFTTVTTAFTTGSVNNMHDSLTALGGVVPLLNMMLNVVFGGDGVGLMNMVLYVILSVFICGLMIGRTPEYLGKRIEGKEMTLAAVGIIVHPLLILAFSALAVIVPGAVAAISNAGQHGLSQILYEFSSSAANNGSGFEGLKDNTVFWNLTTGLVMFAGRYVAIVIQLAIAGSLAAKHAVCESVGTLKTDTLTFAFSLLMVVIIISALTFFPVLVLGPISEHLQLIR